MPKSAKASSKGNKFFSLFVSFGLLISLGLLIYILFGQNLFETAPSGKVFRVVSIISNKKALGDFEAGLEEGFKKLGYSQGKNLNLELVEISSSSPNFQEKITNIILSEPDLLVAFTGELVVPIYKAQTSLNKKIPFVAAVGFDLRDIGFNDFKGTKTFVAGVVGNTQEINKKRLAVVKQILPSFKKIGIITNPDQPTYLGSIEPLRLAAESLSVEVVEFPVTSKQGLDSLLNRLRKGDVDILYTSGQAIIVQNLNRIFETATEKGIPTLDFRPSSTNVVLVNYALTYRSLGLSSAVQADKIFKGKKPGDLPFEEPRDVVFTLNLKIAEKLGIKIPESVIAEANKVIK